MMRPSPYTAREFDTITNDKNFEGRAGYCCLETKHFNELIEFITRNTDVKDIDQMKDVEDYEVLDFLRIASQKGIKGQVVKVRNFVGLIQLPSGCQLQILPKIMLREPSEDEKNKGSDDTKRTIDIFLRMISCIKSFKGKKFNEADLNTRKMSVFEVFIYMYINNVSSLVKKGLKSAYTTEQDNLNFCKGKILINEQIKYNFAHAERFFCAYDEYNLNRPENKIIKTTLLKLGKIAAYPENSKLIKQLLAFFEMVEVSDNYEKDFSLIHFDRSNAEYEEIIEWSKVFLLNKSFTSFSGDSNAIALMFPMEKIYEAYVEKYAKKVFGTDYTVYTQYGAKYLFEDNKKTYFKLKPDIVLKNAVETENGKETIIMDTKWKRLKKGDKNYGISQGDMYQMFAYSKKYKSKHVWLLYPKTEESDEGVLTEYKDIKNENEVKTVEAVVHVYFVDVEKIETSLKNLKEIMQKEKAEQ